MAVELLCVHRIHHPQQHLPSPLVRKSMMHHLKPKIQSRRAVLASSHFNMANQLAAAAAEPQLTWEIAAGALAGVAPFVIAGIEFSKRIIAQKRCKLCGGSGLVKRDQYYFRCNGCGSFPPNLCLQQTPSMSLPYLQQASRGSNNINKAYTIHFVLR